MADLLKVETIDGVKQVVKERTIVEVVSKDDIEEKIRICDRTVTELEAQIAGQNEKKAELQQILTDHAAKFEEVAAAAEPAP